MKFAFADCVARVFSAWKARATVLALDFISNMIAAERITFAEFFAGGGG